MPKFKPGDVIVYGNWEPQSWAIVSGYNQRNEPTVRAFKHNIEGMERWRVRQTETWISKEWSAVLHPDPDMVLADYTKAILLGETNNEDW